MIMNCVTGVTTDSVFHNDGVLWGAGSESPALVSVMISIWHALPICNIQSTLHHHWSMKVAAVFKSEITIKKVARPVSCDLGNDQYAPVCKAIAMFLQKGLGQCNQCLCMSTVLLLLMSAP
jgi:hypothetical protein